MATNSELIDEILDRVKHQEESPGTTMIWLSDRTRLAAEVQRLRAENERLKAALIGAWLNYDAIPYQMATVDYDVMKRGTLRRDLPGKGRPIDLYEMSQYDVGQIQDCTQPATEKT